jgi:hypothetical protein
MQALSLRLSIGLIGILALTTPAGAPSFAEDSPLISIGPRLGFSGHSPFLGREQKHNFHLTDLAAVWRLPWTWQLGDSSWRIGTRLTTSAGHLSAAGDSRAGALTGRMERSGDVRPRRRNRIVQPGEVRHTRSRRAGTSHRHGRRSSASIHACVCRIPCAAFFRCRHLRIVQSRRGSLYRRDRLSLLKRAGSSSSSAEVFVCGNLTHGDARDTLLTCSTISSPSRCDIPLRDRLLSTTVLPGLLGQ